MYNLRKCSKILGVRRTFSETSKTTRPSNICKLTNNKKNTLEQPSPLNPSFKLGKNKKLFDSSWKDWRFRCRGLPIVGPRPVFVATLVDVTSVQLLSYLKVFDHTPRFFKRLNPPKSKNHLYIWISYLFVWSFLRHTQCVFGACRFTRFSNATTIIIIAKITAIVIVIISNPNNHEHAGLWKQHVFFHGHFIPRHLDTYAVKKRTWYCWWKKSCTTRDVENPVNNEINYQPQLVSRISSTN